MTMEIFFRILMSGIISFIISWTFFSRVDSEVGSEHTDHDRQKYLPYTSGTTIPTFLLVLATFFLFYFGIKDTAKVMIDVCFTLFPHICLYYIILISFLPFLRKHISARACAMMWLLPNYLYIIYNTAMELPEPLLVIHTPGNMLWILFYIWLTGFVAVLLWKTIEHYSFRNNILRDTTPITDDAILQILNDIVKEARMPKPIYKLVSSPHVKSPITVGLFRRKMHIILPERNYTPEELELILKHEIIHIAREDAKYKIRM